MHSWILKSAIILCLTSMHWCYAEHKVEALMSIEIDTVDVSGNRSGSRSGIGSSNNTYTE
ncbi:hypothetical protein [Shewanella sp. ALD9]|jgi:hypothetical protein|uniref:hypothetical protein n=1 Tax=Shewanella sp. ALD9 TaxID=2058330 RepID=UPI000C331020|nr:hypothetical protein [Shewanella sp. ALD9]PKH32661.1 hypothetical protein CXF88_12590 [Shewanella sp. ALD9]